MKKITQQEVIDLLKTGKVDENGHLFITLEIYNSYMTWLISTLKGKKQRDFLELKWNRPKMFETNLCNIIAGSFQSITKTELPISTVCIELLSGSYDYVNVK